SRSEMKVRTPPLDTGGWANPQQGRPPPQPSAAKAPPPQMQQMLQQQTPSSGPNQQQQGKAAVRSSNTLSAESIAVGGGLQQQPKQRAPLAAAAARPDAAPQPAGRPPSQQQRPLQPAQPQQDRSAQTSPKQPSPDMDHTEKKKAKAGSGPGNKITKLLDVKFSKVVDDHKKFLGTLPNSVSRAAFDDNLCLNRFEDVICIDQTRVLFSDSSLYLNANWVTIEPGKKPDDPPKKQAIVAQLPLPECAVAFWSMICENDIRGVLLFADDNEFLTFEADKIFPMNMATVKISPRITVTHTHRLAVSSEWTMNVYLVCRGDVRKYVHVHCFAWSGDEVIKLQSLWQIESVFRKYPAPHVYMSSAGVGRASTFAALKMVHAKMHDESCKEVSLNNCIASLRENRLHSIQCFSQSITLHSAMIQHIIDCPSFEKYENDPRVRAFAEQYKEHMANSKE
ncbi:hypothetical protein PENTCL1PPCAC_23519, partial [Pristionchus entomophagus]